VTGIELGRLRWLGQVCRRRELEPCIKLTVHKLEGTRRVGKPSLRWLESVEEDLKNIGVWNWIRKSRDREQWRAIVVEAKVHRGL
jgi:hypothetical protein